MHHQASGATAVIALVVVQLQRLVALRAPPRVLQQIAVLLHGSSLPCSAPSTPYTAGGGPFCSSAFRSASSITSRNAFSRSCHATYQSPISVSTSPISF